MTTKKGLWVLFALPRSRSTAFFRAMTNRRDMLCIHEPFCTLADTGSVSLTDGCGGEVRLDGLDDVAAHILELSQSRRVFVKETTDNDLLPLADTGFLGPETQIAFLVREPGPAIASHLKMRAEAQVEDFGFGNLHALMREAIDLGRKVQLLQADELATDPRACLETFCEVAGLEFKGDMLIWKPRDLKQWERTRDWHAGVAGSTGFIVTSPVADAPPELVQAVTSDYRAILSLGRKAPIAEGGCHCGKLRYRLWQAPRDLAECHCTLCRRTSGAPHIAWGSVDRDHFELTGPAARYESTPGSYRQFCPTCGTQITFTEQARSQEIDFTLASLDDPEQFRPEAALHVDFRLSWDEVAVARRSFGAERTYPADHCKN